MTAMNPLIKSLLHEEFADQSVPQIIFSYAQPQKTTKPRISVDELTEVITELAARRVYFQGTKGQEGELDRALRLIIAPMSKSLQEPLSSLYPKNQVFMTQLEKVNYLINWFGHDTFKEETLRRKFDKDVADTIKSCYDDIQAFNTGVKSNQPKEFAKGLQGLDIDVDMIIHRSDKRITTFPAFGSKKYGKTALSLADKTGFYIADEFPFMNKRKGEAHIIDSYMPIALYNILDNPQEHRFVQRLFRTEKKQEEVYALLDDLKNKERYHKGIMQINNLKKITEKNIKTLPKYEQQQFLTEIYTRIVKELKDMRGFQLIYNTEDSITDKSSLIGRQKDLYVPESLELHNKEKDDRVIDQIHGKWRPETFGDVEQYEIQIFNTQGLILDLLGPHNSYKYHNTKLNTKYKDFSKGQIDLANNIKNNVYWFTSAIEPAFERVVDAFEGRYTSTKENIMLIAREEANKAARTLKETN